MTEPHHFHSLPDPIVDYLRGLQASADVIDAIIANNDGSADTRDSMTRNVSHIHIMCQKSELEQSDLTTYMGAAERGLAWLAQN